MARLVFRGGPATVDNLTPRPAKDTRGQPGRSPGLSISDSLEAVAQPGAKAQVIDLDLLGNPLIAFADDPTLEGGEAGHLSIAPTKSDGFVDEDLLQEWAATRGSGNIHRLTVIVTDAVVREVRRPR